MKLLFKLGLITSLIISSSLASEKVYKLKMATTWGPTLSPLIDSAINMAKIAEEMSNGQIEN